MRASPDARIIEYYASVWRLLLVSWLQWPEDRAQQYIRGLLDQHATNPLLEHEVPAWYVVDVIVQHLSPEYAGRYSPDLWGSLAVLVTNFAEPKLTHAGSHDWAELDRAVITRIANWSAGRQAQ